MDSLEKGARFTNYREVLDSLNEYCVEANLKFFKKSWKPLLDADKCLTAACMYREVEFACDSKSEGTNDNCPAFFRFQVPCKGTYLELVALSGLHNHPTKNTAKLGAATKSEDDISPYKKSRESEEDESVDVQLDQDNEDEGFTGIIPKVTFEFRGLMAPTLTAFKENLSLDLDVIGNYAKFLKDSGIKGVLVNGTSGEGMSMSVQERKKAAEEWVKAVRKTNQHLMVQIGGAPLPDVLELAKHAEAVGVHSLLCLPDLYNKPTNSAELIRYLKTVGAAAPKTPLLYYHIPSYTNVNIHMGQFLNDSVGKIPTFHGIKFTSNALDEGTAAVRANNGKYAVFLGADQLLSAAFTLGFDSAIATSLNMFPQFGIRILKAVKESKLAEAQKAQNALTDICSVVTKHGGWVPTMKVAMSQHSPINVGAAREPLLNITREQADEMRTSLKQYF